MAAPEYTRRTFDMAVLRDRAAILDAGVLINGVTVAFVPAGSNAQLHFGQNKDPVDITTGDSWDISSVDARGCPIPLDEGLYMTNPAGAGTTILIVSQGQIAGGIGRNA